MSGFFHNPFTEWMVTGLAIVAFIIAFKFVVGYLPDKGGFVGAFKQVALTV